MSIFIPGNVPSLKNSKRIITFGPRCQVCQQFKFRKLAASKAIVQWKKDTYLYWEKYQRVFRKEVHQRDLPLKVQFQFIRKTRHKFDYTNALDTVQDMMVEYHWIEDDNSDVLIPVIIPYVYNKHEPGVRIKVL